MSSEDILEQLYAAKARVLAEDEAREPLAKLLPRAEASIATRRSFRTALGAAPGPAVIAEIKRASPSKGLIARNLDPADVARRYQTAGADAISVLTESDHFLGDLGYLPIARENATLPLLRKDFLTTPYQVAQSAAYGADAILAIVAGISDETLGLLIAEASRWKLDVLVEVHSEDELRRAIATGATLVGINNRDLRTFETSLTVTLDLLPLVPPEVMVISESGVSTAEEAHELAAAGARGFLIGETLMRAEDPAELIAAVKSAVPSP